MKRKLLVIIPDRLSVLIAKGEITQRYYNPGNLFDEVHILMTNADRPNINALEKSVGRATLVLHNLPAGKNLFLKTLGWQYVLLRKWIFKGVELAREIQPDLVRVHNNFLEGYLALNIKKRLRIPYVVSLHGVWDKDCLGTAGQKLFGLFRKKLEKTSLRSADCVVAVYKPILRYAHRYGATDVRLIYNVVSIADKHQKSDYKRSEPPRLITINRQVKEKNPENIIRAVSRLNCRYTIVGNGGYHEYLKRVAEDCGCADRVSFIQAMPNEELCSLLKTFDVMVSHCDYWGISKTIIEGALAGLPIVVNQHPIEPIPDYEGDWLSLCSNTEEGYYKAISRLVDDAEARRNLGRRALLHAKNFFDPAVQESKIVDIYQSLTTQVHS